MKRKITTIPLLALATIICFAFVKTPQKDAKATEILNALSEKTKTYTTIQADFTYAVKSAEVKEEQKGKLKLKGDKYRYEIFGITKISDGKKICTISEGDEEVIITNADFNDPDEFSPSEIFSIYKQGYKYRYIKETKVNNKPYHVIELYPETSQDSPYRRITMFVELDKSSIYKVDFYHKTTSKVFSIIVDKATYNQTIPDAQFRCDCSVNPDFDCDDQTDSK